MPLSIRANLHMKRDGVRQHCFLVFIIDGTLHCSSFLAGEYLALYEILILLCVDDPYRQSCCRI